MDITVVIPLYNEDESLPELYAWIERVMNSNNFTYEVIFVNDGSTDHSWDVIEQLSRDHEEEGHQVPPQLRQEPGSVLRIQGSPGRRGDNHGR